MTSVADFDLSGVALLVDVMSRLRDPENGCPWDLKQDHKSLARYTLEEAYEVVEAIELGDLSHMKEELGDLLLQIVFHGQIAQENKVFTFDDVARCEAEKMVERHPHVFGDRDNVVSAEDVLKNWEADKAKKREEKAFSDNKEPSILDEVNTALPAMSRGLKLQQRAARVGFDWGNPISIVKKIREEVDEFDEELRSGVDREAMEDELGDVFFVLINLARHLDIDPERALRRTNQKFERRFKFIEKSLANVGQDIAEATLDEMEELWLKAKIKEKTANSGA